MLENNFEAFKKKYRPIAQESDIDFLVMEDELPAETDRHKVWSMCEFDGDCLIYPGLHPVNRMAYMITEVPWSDKSEFWFWVVGAETEWVTKLYDHRGHELKVKGRPAQIWCVPCDTVLLGTDIYDSYGEDYSDDQSGNYSYPRFVREYIAPHRKHRLSVGSGEYSGIFMEGTAIDCETCGADATITSLTMIEAIQEYENED